jgi:hypothetical protein
MEPIRKARKELDAPASGDERNAASGFRRLAQHGRRNLNAL